MKSLLILSAIGILTLVFLSCGQQTSQSQVHEQHDHMQADDCDNPDADPNCCFVNMPATLTNVMTIGGKKEPGEPLVITGTVFKKDGITPCPDVILYAYHTDNTGHYSKKGNETGVQKWHGHLHGWCKTDPNGKYEIHSIRPARYPGNTMPAHIHCVVKEPGGKQPFYINDFVFKDDSLVAEKYLSMLNQAGGTGVVTVTKKVNGTWEGTRSIILVPQ